ncbi:hypothetical protein HELRODRAFT_173175 [Helobdella robusta]|uniref:Uncharacterized protein n=1 Tax=Helobdella robusta TaxID=6412 RepID=T1F6I5_HELRO|nr:hypothetical protein HELRODRAFT_173175 [Helobdella robusta]ESO04097.1 hypothetical protein HELRODRAFT_173175 [Helobdella robusta]
MQKLFNPSNSLTPSFSIDDCKKYFYNILHDPFHNKFRLSNWVPTLQQPTIPCNIDPPTYHEMATVIRKCKLRASPCPLDQISIIVFKKCPMLRTILHQLIVECWSLQSLIYDYFTSNYGTLETKTISSVDQNKPICKKLFNPSNSSLPLFNVVECEKFFKNILNYEPTKKFRLPNWIHTLPDPSFLCSVHTPTFIINHSQMQVKSNSLD